MSKRTAKFAPILLAGVAAGAVVVALPVRAVHAADNCLSEPKGDAHGKHWYYRIEHGTGRHCWYMRSEDDKAARSDAPSATPAKRIASQQPDAAASRSFADAHDEVAPRASTTDDAANAAPAAASVWQNAPAAAAAAPSDSAATAPAATPEASPSPVASRWPQPSGTAPAASPHDDASAMVANAEPNTTAEAASPPAPPADLAAAPAERRTGSLQKLLLVAFSALALAGFTGSAVYRLGRRRHRNDWLRERTAWQDAPNPHRPPWVDEPRIQPNHQAVADLDHEEPDLDHPQEIEPQSGFSLAANEPEGGSERIEKIEEFLARLTQQLHEELDGTRPHSA
jgi:hypothetical protein